MAAVWVCEDGQDLQPVDAEVTILFRDSQATPPIPPSESCRLDSYIRQAQIPQPVLDPIRLRGVGSTTL